MYVAIRSFVLCETGLRRLSRHQKQRLCCANCGDRKRCECPLQPLKIAASIFFACHRGLPKCLECNRPLTGDSRKHLRLTSAIARWPGLALARLPILKSAGRTEPASVQALLPPSIRPCSSFVTCAKEQVPMSE